MKLYKPITVDLYNTYPLPRMSAQQHNVGRGAIITLTANGQVIALGEETVRIFARRPDGNVSYLDCTITEDGKIQADFTDQMLAAEGNVQVELEFTTTETNITTPIFIVEVNKSNVKDGVKSSNEYKALEKYTEEAKEGGKAIYIEILVDSVTKEYGYKSDNFEKVAAAFEKGKTIILHVLDTNEYAYLQTATKDYFKFILFGKNDVNAFQIFYLYSNGIIANDFINIPVLYEWALQRQKPTYTYSDVGADKDGAARDTVNAHNISAQAHSDLRVWIQQLQDRINTVANSDDVSLDQLAELVAYIKDNRELIAQVTTDKVNVADIIDNLSTADARRPLSANQGAVLKEIIDTELETLRNLINEIIVNGGAGTVTSVNNVMPDEFGNVSLHVPSNTSDLNNDSGFITTEALATKEFSDQQRGVFIATYGLTKFAEMLAAWNAGKFVILQGDVASARTVRLLAHVTSTKMWFGRVLSGEGIIDQVIVTSENKWSVVSHKYALAADLKNTYTSLETSIDDSNHLIRSDVSRNNTRVFQPYNSGLIECARGDNIIIYCTGDNVATLTAYGTRNQDANGNQHTLSGKCLTVYCGYGGSNDYYQDDSGVQIRNIDGVAVWFATAMSGTSIFAQNMEVRRGIIWHPSEGHYRVVISYPAGCNIIVSKNHEL